MFRRVSPMKRPQREKREEGERRKKKEEAPQAQITPSLIDHYTANRVQNEVILTPSIHDEEASAKTECSSSRQSEATKATQQFLRSGATNKAKFASFQCYLLYRLSDFPRVVASSLSLILNASVFVCSFLVVLKSRWKSSERLNKRLNWREETYFSYHPLQSQEKERNTAGNDRETFVI